MIRQFKFEDGLLPGLKIIAPFMAEDGRGYYMKYYEKSTFEKNGIFFTPYEEAQTRSAKGVVRGLHFQTKFSQPKLARCTTGEVFDVAVDVRPNSPTFGHWAGEYLSEENHKMVYIPMGFAHGSIALTDGAVLAYISGDRYYPEAEYGIRWDDPEVGVEWPLDRVDKVSVSEKDAALPTLKEWIAMYENR